MATALDTAQRARSAALALQAAPTELKNRALRRIHDTIRANKAEILAANRADLEVEAGTLSASLYKRLDLAGPRDSKFEALLQGILDVVELEDPVGKVTLASQLDNGLDLLRVQCPVGVILIIFEARPEVVVQISSLVLKSGNAVVLKGGKEAAASNQALWASIQQALASLSRDGDDVDGNDGGDASGASASKAAIPPDAVQLVSSRDAVTDLLKLDGLIDLVIPRGSASLVKHVRETTRIPVLSHADGICSVYVDRDADARMAADVAVDSKTNYPAACNAAETLLVHADAAASHLPVVGGALLARGVQLRCDAAALAVLREAHPADAAAGRIVPATQADFDTEFLELVMAVAVVCDVDAAIAHINAHGSKHTDAIVTASEACAKRFMANVDAAAVYWNASTRFTDGFRYGFGAEVGVSTNKTHVRGPVGLEGLMIYRYRIYGNGHTVAPYNSGERTYHRAAIPLEQAQVRV
ncbi:glutamate-5-semialdehyde dehydrogenase [Polyrhizophydium stewartii]|uniref:glutamate-5-semialdehyde dehydrogenase n=1 Tax=Polyrhizophydium stewartii TaxID=2732419 RepID=A0ABR4NC60_9FUNG|nr:hypothetical protein HK105_003292 [Polyrhizophydium stewartii]